jgi:teichuronic acid biosynthesis glycosyltransferase TuaH
MAGVSWDGIRGTDRHLATAMARHARILWVDPPVSPVRQALRHNAMSRSLRPVLSVVDDQITRLTPVALPGLSRPGVRVTTAALVRGQVRWALRRLSIQPFAVVATQLQDLLGHWGRNVVNVLYGTDDYVAGAKLMGLSARHLRRQESRALTRADVVAAVSPQLVRRWTELGANAILIPNGCRVANVDAAAAPNDLPDLPDLPPPVVGLVGQLSERIDLDILEAIAEAEYTLLIVGPLDPRWEGRQRFKDLTGRSNVHYVGPVPSDAVPSYLAAIDLGTTPYRDTPFNRASFPLKTLEYLAAGLPVVSADLPATRWLREGLTPGEDGAAADQVLALVSGNIEFTDAIRRIVGTPHCPPPDSWTASARVSDPARADLCVAFAARHAWSRRADAFARAIGLPPIPGKEREVGHDSAGRPVRTARGRG